MTEIPFDPQQSMANTRHEFGEHGGVNMYIEASTTFTVMTLDLLPEIFAGQLGPNESGCYLYGRHFNPTVFVLGRKVAAMEGAEAGYGTARWLSAIAEVISYSLVRFSIGLTGAIEEQWKQLKEAIDQC